MEKTMEIFAAIGIGFVLGLVLIVGGYCLGAFWYKCTKFFSDRKEKKDRKKDRKKDWEASTLYSTCEARKLIKETVNITFDLVLLKLKEIYGETIPTKKQVIKFFNSLKENTISELDKSGVKVKEVECDEKNSDVW